MEMKENHKSERRAGLLTTLIFHLSVLIILLIFSIGAVVSQENSFVLDFTKQEQLEQEQREMELREDVEKEIDDMISAMQSGRNEIRNVVVDAGSQLKDDRHANPAEVYDAAAELQRKLDASRRDALRQQAADEAVELQSEVEAEARGENQSETSYSGPSVISYTLEGRKANYLPVPAYKGYGSGDVCVEISVNEKGRVVDAAVVKALSTGDESLHSFAIDAARRSRFSAAQIKSQKGTILYRFIAQ